MGPERVFAVLAFSLLLAACGVEGPPEPPPPREDPVARTSITLGGAASVGVIGRS